MHAHCIGSGISIAIKSLIFFSTHRRHVAKRQQNHSPAVVDHDRTSVRHDFCDVDTAEYSSEFSRHCPVHSVTDHFRSYSPTYFARQSSVVNPAALQSPPLLSSPFIYGLDLVSTSSSLPPSPTPLCSYHRHLRSQTTDIGCPPSPPPVDSPRRRLSATGEGSRRQRRQRRTKRQGDTVAPAASAVAVSASLLATPGECGTYYPLYVGELMQHDLRHQRFDDNDDDVMATLTHVEQPRH